MDVYALCMECEARILRVSMNCENVFHLLSITVIAAAAAKIEIN
jgi:hypothetical protein